MSNAKNSGRTGKAGAHPAPAVSLREAREFSYHMTLEQIETAVNAAINSTKCPALIREQLAGLDDFSDPHTLFFTLDVLHKYDADLSAFAQQKHS